MTAFWVAVAGGLGCAARYGVGNIAAHWFSDRLPWGTLIVNILGSFVIGVVFAMFITRGEIDSRLRVALTTGFLGGFTTYSAFAFDSIVLLERRNMGLLVVYLGVMIAAAMAACYLGVLTGRALAATP